MGGNVSDSPTNLPFETPLDPEDAENALKWLQGIGGGAATGAATGAVGGPWGALVGGLVGAGIGALQTAQQQQQPQARPPVRASVAGARPGAPVAAPAAPLPAAPPAAAAGVPAPSPAQLGSALADLERLMPVLMRLAQAFGGRGAGSPAPRESASAEDAGGVRYRSAGQHASEHHPVVLATPVSTPVVPGSRATPSAAASDDLDALLAGQESAVEWGETATVEHDCCWE